MYYKKDWPKAQERLSAFWNNEVIDRCCAAVFAPRNSKLDTRCSGLGHPLREILDARCTGPEENYKREISRFEKTYFGGEAIPCTHLDWADMAIAVLYEGKGGRDSNEFLKQIIEVIRYFLEKNKGDFFVGACEVGSAGDILSLTRGAEKFSIDLIEKSEDVKNEINKIADTWISLNEEFYRLTSEANDNGGVSPWLGLWAPGRTAMAACDFSIGISAKHFREFFVPEIKKEAGWCEFATYHIDGAGALKTHLDSLLEIEEIDNIQFSPGAGSLLTNITQYKKIQKAGKRLYLFAKPQEIKELLSELSAKGLFICTQADSQEQADELLKKVAKWSKAR
jgi:hypothetical protein